MFKSDLGRRGRRARYLTITAALVGSALAPTAALASAPAGGEPLETGENITVVHNIDFIAAFGVGTVGDSVTVEVFRKSADGDLVLLGTETGPLADTLDGPGIEVNHGPEGPPGDGDCWQDFTPDIVPYDLVRVTNNDTADVDEVLVDDITFDSATVDAATGEAQYRGFAISAATGLPFPAATLDSGFWRTDVGGEDARGESPTVEVGADGQYVARWIPPTFGQFVGDNQASATDVANAARAEFGYGHVPPVDPTAVNPETQLADGLGSSPGPALGCDEPGLSPSESNSVRTATPNPLGLSSGAVQITGTKVTDASTDVQVTLSDGTNTVGPLAATVTGNDWTLSVPRTADGAGNSWDELADGVISISGAFVHGAETLGGEVLRIRKDTAPPPPVDPGNGGGNGGGAGGGAGAGGAGVGAGAGGTGSPVVLPAVQRFVQVSSLRARSRVRLRSARRSGIRVSFVAPEGANVVRVQLFRGSRSAQADQPVGERTVQLSRTGRHAVRINARSVRRALRRGVYRIVISAGQSEDSLNQAVGKRIRIVR